MKQQTKRMLSAAFSLILLVLALVNYFYFIQPAYEDEQATRGLQISRQSFLDYESSAIKQVKNLIDTYQGQLQIQDAVSLALPPREDLGGALSQIYGLAQGSGLALQGVSATDGGAASVPATASAGSSFQTELKKSVSSVIFQIKASGSYESLKTFLSKLETNIRVFDLKTLTIQPVPTVSQGRVGQAQNLYSFDLSLVTYYQNQ